MTTIKGNAHEVLERARKQVEESRDMVYTIGLLPEELVTHDFGEGIAIRVNDYRSWVAVEFVLCQESDEDRAAAVASIKDFLGREIGFAFERVGHYYGEKFYYTGDMEVGNGKTVKLEINAAPKPEGCQLIKKVTMEEVTRYEAICGDTGERV